jgi:hypothetical protein
MVLVLLRVSLCGSIFTFSCTTHHNTPQHTTQHTTTHHTTHHNTPHNTPQHTTQHTTTHNTPQYTTQMNDYYGQDKICNHAHTTPHHITQHITLQSHKFLNFICKRNEWERTWQLIKGMFLLFSHLFYSFFYFICRFSLFFF